ncbi:MAG: HNH endonuclease, partial [Bacilli bacterium]|nr:HNH endonuclease [Bacilli bacterium]
INDDDKLSEEVEEVSSDIKYTLFNHISNNFATYFLFWIELYRRNDSDDESSLKYVYSLEHIMPRKWKENWFNDIGNGLKDVNGNQLDVPQSIEYRDNHIDMLGNMTLLKGRLNSSISNKDFPTKMVKIKEFASLKITKNDIVDRYYSRDNEGKITSWNEKLIEERNNNLREEILDALLY